MIEFDYRLDFQKIDFRKRPSLYRIGRGEQGVLLVGPNTDEALVCSCSHPAIERWKESEEGKKLQKDLDERFEKLSEKNFLMEDGK